MAERTTRYYRLAPAVLALALGFSASPSVAAPLNGSASIRAAASDAGPLWQIQSQRKAKRRQVSRAPHAVQPSPYPGVPVPPYGVPSPDTVGSLGTDRYGRTINRFTGQVYHSCVFDEGYGRVRPCDAGSGGSGGSYN
jgi:hypothetical protein